MSERNPAEDYADNHQAVRVEVARRRRNALDGVEVFKRQLLAHGIDVEELEEKFSWRPEATEA